MEFPHTCLTHTHCVLQSESNVQGILVSRPEVGIPSFGLTEKGKIQAREVNTGPTPNLATYSICMRVGVHYYY